jgi:uncharacterized protein YcbX
VGEPVLSVTRLSIYPVKSLRGIDLEAAELTAHGLRHDRRWMLLAANDRFVTQRDLPRLALVRQSLDENGVTLSLPGSGSLQVEFDDRAGESISTAVWGDACAVIDVGADASRWLSEALHSATPLRLVRMAPDWIRPQRHPELMGADTRGVFADGAPLLVANEASLQALNESLTEQGVDTVPMNRFRPNVVIAGLPAFAEQQVGVLAGPGYGLRLCYPCERCVVTTIDQATGIPDAARQPFLTLRELNPMPDRPRAPAFAQNSALDHGAGATIRIGDPLQWNPA